MTLGERIREIRQSQGLTLQAVADRVGTSRSYVWAIEMDNDLNVGFRKMVNVAKALDVSLDELGEFV